MYDVLQAFVSPFSLLRPVSKFPYFIHLCYFRAFPRCTIVRTFATNVTVTLQSAIIYNALLRLSMSLQPFCVHPSVLLSYKGHSAWARRCWIYSYIPLAVYGALSYLCPTAGRPLTHLLPSTDCHTSHPTPVVILPLLPMILPLRGRLVSVLAPTPPLTLSHTLGVLLLSLMASSAFISPLPRSCRGTCIAWLAPLRPTHTLYRRRPATLLHLAAPYCRTQCPTPRLLPPCHRPCCRPPGLPVSV